MRTISTSRLLVTNAISGLFVAPVSHRKTDGSTKNDSRAFYQIAFRVALAILWHRMRWHVHKKIRITF